VNVPALVMLRAGPAATTLSVCDPDLHLYQGIESDQFNPNGSQREVSIYSRTWFRAASAPSKVRVTLEGNYALVLPDARVTLVPAAPGHTMLEFTCREGLPVEVQLARQP
jgi:chondroitin-sulfate-ABC endolyase/exolyase